MNTFRIISFDGGGIKGALSSLILKRLANENKGLLENTHLFAGTSTGALIALCLASGLSGEEVDNIYSYKNIKNIFTPKRLNLFRPRYSNKKLKTFIETTLSEEATLNDLKKYVLIPSFHVQGITENHWQGVFFNNLSENPTLEVKLVDAALCSSAAPTYFPSHKNCIDGGLLTNSPALASIISVLHYGKEHHELKDFKVLSIGTGLTPKTVKSNTTNWGALQWGLRPFAREKLPLLSILLNSDSALEDLYCRELLGDNYLRINPILLENVEIDDCSKIPYLKQVANNYDLKKANSFIREFYLK